MLSNLSCPYPFAGSSKDGYCGDYYTSRLFSFAEKERFGDISRDFGEISRVISKRRGTGVMFRKNAAKQGS